MSYLTNIFQMGWNNLQLDGNILSSHCHCIYTTPLVTYYWDHKLQDNVRRSNKTSRKGITSHQSKNIKDTSLHPLIMEKNTTCRSKISWRRSCKVSLVTGLISCLRESPLGDNLGDVILTRKLQVPEKKEALQYLFIEYLVCNLCLYRIYIRQNHGCVRYCRTKR